MLALKPSQRLQVPKSCHQIIERTLRIRGTGVLGRSQTVTDAAEFGAARAIRTDVDAGWAVPSVCFVLFGCRAVNSASCLAMMASIWAQRESHCVFRSSSNALRMAMSLALSSSFECFERYCFWLGGGTIGVKMRDGGSRRERRLNGEPDRGVTVSGMCTLLLSVWI